MIPVVYNVRSLSARRVTTLVTAIGVALVVFVFAAALMLSHGIRAALAATGDPDNATVMRDGSESDIESSVEREQAKVLCARPEVQIGADGKPLCSAELSVLVEGDKVGGGVSNVEVRGIDGESLAVHSGVKVIEGRAPRPGTSEIMVGKAMAGRFEGFVLGGAAHWVNQTWPVVGVFEAGGSAYESQVWADADTLMHAFERPAFSTVTMRLRDPKEIDLLKAEVSTDPRLSLQVQGERAWYASQSNELALFIRIIGLVVSIIFAVGATIGAMITMYAQVASRVREIGTLRAIGFRRRSVLLSFWMEAMLLSLLGGAIGLAASSLMGFATFSTLNFQTFSEVTFRFTPTPAVYLAGLAFSLAMGFLGGFLPAWRAARLSPLEAMKAE